MRGIRPTVGVCCLVVGALIVLLCAPEWLVALIIAWLLFMIALACFGKRF